MHGLQPLTTDPRLPGPPLFLMAHSLLHVLEQNGEFRAKVDTTPQISNSEFYNKIGMKLQLKAHIFRIQHFYRNVVTATH